MTAADLVPGASGFDWGALPLHADAPARGEWPSTTPVTGFVLGSPASASHPPTAPHHGTTTRTPRASRRRARRASRPTASSSSTPRACDDWTARRARGGRTAEPSSPGTDCRSPRCWRTARARLGAGVYVRHRPRVPRTAAAPPRVTTVEGRLLHPRPGAHLDLMQQLDRNEGHPHLHARHLVRVDDGRIAWTYAWHGDGQIHDALSALDRG